MGNGITSPSPWMRADRSSIWMGRSWPRPPGEAAPAVRRKLRRRSASATIFKGNQFTGSIDDVSIWNVALSGAFISQYTRRAMLGTEPGLVAYYRMNEAAGTMVADATGHGYTGTFNPAGISWIVSTAPFLTTPFTITGRVTSAGSGLAGTTVAALRTPVSSTAPVPIPDVSTADSTILISATDAISRVRVSADIAHSFRGDLEVTLIHPDGTQVRLKNADVDDDGVDLATTYPDPTAPVGDLASLNGKPMNGTWRLRVRHTFAGDTGTINGWSLTLGLPVTTTDANGDYTLSTFSLGTFEVQPERAGFVFTPASRTVTPATSGADFAVVTAFISGRVTAGGAGLGGAMVTIGGFTTTTDANGNYRIDGLIAAASYTVTVSGPGFGFTQAQVTAGLGASNADFTVASYPIAGRIVDRTGGGVAGVLVSTGALSGLSDANGNYLIAQVTPGSRTITPAKGGVTFSPANRTVTLPPAATGANFTTTSSPPPISNIADLVIAKGATTGALRFTVGDVETRAGMLTVAGASSDPLLVPATAFAFSGVGAERTVTITPAPARIGTATITITVTDEAGLTASDTFSLRVNAAPLAGVGRALSFNGTSDGVLASANVIDFKGSYTIECWTNAPSGAVARTIAAQGTGAATTSLGTNAAGKVQAGPWDTGIAFPFGAWHHLAVVKETGNARLYIDGVLRASRGSSRPLPTQNARFDIGRGLAGNFWLGAIDELRVWNVARSAAQIAANQNVRVLGAEPNLTGLWRFDEANGATAFDATPLASHGTITGAARIQARCFFRAMRSRNMSRSRMRSRPSIRMATRSLSRSSRRPCAAS